MLNNIDHKMLSRFAQMVRSSLPQIRAGIESFLHDATQQEALEDAYQDLHPIKDAAQMLHLSGLSQIASYVEEMIEEIATGPAPTDADQGSWLCGTVDQIGHYLESMLSGDGRERDIITAAVQSCRRFKGLPEADDEAEVEALIQGQEDTSDATQPTEMPAGEPAGGPAGEIDADAVTPPADVAHASLADTEAPSDSEADIPAELVEGFLMEAEEYLDIIGRVLPDLEDQPEHKEQLQSVRRSVHTLKGAAGIVGFGAVSQLAHRMEDLLDELYDEHVPLTSQAKELLCATFDALDDFVRDKRLQGDFDQIAQPLYSAYTALLEATPADTTSLPDASLAQNAAAPMDAEQRTHEGTTSNVQDVVATDPQLEGAEMRSQGAVGPVVHHAADVIRVPLARLDAVMRFVGELVISRSVYEQHLGHLIRQVDELHLSIDRLRRLTTTIETQYEVSALADSRRAPMHQVTAARPLLGSATQFAEFDELEFDRYSEFHLLSRALTETTADIGALGQEFGDILGDFDSYLTRQGRLTSEIQDKLMQLRTVPLATLATRLHRAVRMTSKQKGKDVDLVLEGEDVQFDKTMLEEMAEPLLHLLRNAVDHGMEPPALRQQVGKPQQGQIQLRAFREGTQIVIQMRDDGAGIDPQRLRAAAVQGGFMSEEDVAQLAPEQLYPLIFTPGFSTAREVSEISGRGVGMDIVHTTVSRLKGRITIDSTLGQGTTFTIRLPLTLAIARMLLVKAHSETFAIPLADVTQILRLEPEAIEQVGDTSVIRVDGQVFPVVRLGERLRLRHPADSSISLLPIVVTQVGDKQVGFVVDQLIGGREVVVKTLGNHLRRVHGVIGSTLMGDGSIVLILNPSELVQDYQHQGTSRPTLSQTQVVRQSDPIEVLIVDDSFSVRRVVSNLIKSVGWQPVLAKDGLEALDIIQRAARLPDVILLDVEMPQMDGYELTSTLRAHASYRHLPIVMLTSRSGEKHRQKAFAVGATEYLVKPYQDQTMLDVIRRLVPRLGGSAAA